MLNLISSLFAIMRLLIRIIIGALFVILIVFSIRYYANSINSFFRNSASANILLLILIVVDLAGVLITPFIERQIEDKREQNKRITEESIAKLDFNYQADDEQLLTIEVSSLFTSSIKKKPPYFKEMEEHLQGYPKLWKLVQELPAEYRKTKQTFESLVSDMRKELESETSSKNLKFPQQTKDDVLFKLAQYAGTEFIDGTFNSWSIRGYDQTAGMVSLGGYHFSIPKYTAEVLEKKMQELKGNVLYKKKFETIVQERKRIFQKASEFQKERDAIVEDLRLHSYKNLKEKPWYKRF